MDDSEEREQGREGDSGTGGRICKFVFLKYSDCRLCSFFLVLQYSVWCKLFVIYF